MSWWLGPIELEAMEYPNTIRFDSPHNVRAVTAPGMMPYLYSLGINVEAVELTMWLQSLTATELRELSRNLDMQPFRVIGEDIAGFYYVRSMRDEGRAGVLNFKLTRLSLYQYGGLGAYIQGYQVSNLETVTNDWNL